MLKISFYRNSINCDPVLSHSFILRPNIICYLTRRSSKHMGKNGRIFFDSVYHWTYPTWFFWLGNYHSYWFTVTVSSFYLRNNRSIFWNDNFNTSVNILIRFCYICILRNAYVISDFWVTILLSLNFDPLAPRCFICFRGNIYTAIIGRTCYSRKPFVSSIKVWKVQYYTIITRRIFGIYSISSNF